MFKDKEKELEETVAKKGDIRTFFVGIVVFAIGMFMMLNNINVQTSHGIGYGYQGLFGGWKPPFGVLIIPLLVGIIILVATEKELLGTLFVCIGLLIIIVGVLVSIVFTFKITSAYYMMIMFGFMAVGTGMVIKGLFGKGK